MTFRLIRLQNKIKGILIRLKINYLFKTKINIKKFKMLIKKNRMHKLKMMKYTNIKNPV